MNGNIEDILNSDDELPMDYYEDAAIPAYKIDSRFDEIQFKWINNTNLQTFKTECNISKELIIPCESSSSQMHHAPILKKGVLNKHDLFCLKSVEGLTGDSTFIWLINFLLYKDVQANYLFLKSCLVSCN